MNALILKCNQCKKDLNIKKDQLSMELVESHERKMGTENTYSYQDDFICECGNEINILVELYEYPVGVENYKNTKVENAKVLEDNIILKDYLECITH